MTAPVGYVAANANGDQFRSWEPAGPAWTPDKKKAVIFLRRRDAEAVFGEDEDTWKIMPVAQSDLDQ